MADRLDKIRDENAELLKKASIEQKNRRRVYTDCFGTDQGRRVLLDLLTRSYLFSSTFTGNSYTYFNEGARSALALELMAVIPALCGQVISEHLKEVEEVMVRTLDKEGDK